MIDPLELNSVSGQQAGGIQQTPAAGQTSFSDLMPQLIAQAGPDTAEGNILKDWTEELMTGDQHLGAPQHDHLPRKKGEENKLTAYLQNPVNTANPIMTAAPPGVDNAAGADNSNTGSINSGTII
ncbi:MAG: hypothetical protein JW873_02550 [Candidatus Saganbacteria bacterium]|nr:hypothetical protein [Candidatus Saganbacteria bacterium]